MPSSPTSIFAASSGPASRPASRSAPSSVQAQSVLRVTAIPDESPTELARKFEPLGRYLESRTGMKVEWTPVTDYAAAVETLVNRKVDLAWFGGFTFVQAHVRSGGKVVPLVQRAEDEKFRSVFITSVGSGIDKLEDLKGKTLSFGSQSSTSGHLMPRSFLLAAKVNPDVDLKRVSFSGAHDATIAAVASGKVDAGALNISVWEKFVADKKVDTERRQGLLHHADLLRLQLDGARRHAGRPAQQAAAGLPRPRSGHAAGQGDPRPAARHAVSCRPGSRTTAASALRPRTPDC